MQIKISLFYFTGIAISLLVASLSFAEERYIQVSSTMLRKEPSFLADRVTSLSYAEKVSPLSEEKNEWINVETKNGNIGYLHVGALTVTKTHLLLPDSRGINIEVGETEVYLAGKGFNSSIEEIFKNSSESLNYAELDLQIKNQQPSYESLRKFIAEGGLNP